MFICKVARCHGGFIQSVLIYISNGQSVPVVHLAGWNGVGCRVLDFDWAEGGVTGLGCKI